MQGKHGISALLGNDKNKAFLSQYYQKLKTLITDHYAQSHRERKQLLIVLAEKHDDFTVVVIKEMINEIIKELSLKNVYVELDKKALGEEFVFNPRVVTTYVQDSKENNLVVIPVDDESRSNSYNGSKESMRIRDNRIVDEVNKKGEGGFLSVGFEHMEGVLSGKDEGKKLDDNLFHILAINIVQPITRPESEEIAKKAPDEDKEAIISRQLFFSENKSIVQLVPDRDSARAIHEYYDVQSYKLSKLSIYKDVGEISGHPRSINMGPPSFTGNGFPPLTGIPSFSSGGVPSFSSDIPPPHTYAERGASLHFFDRQAEPAVKNMLPSGISIRSYGGEMQLVFNADNLDKAREFLKCLPNASYLTILEDCIMKKTDFVMEYAGLEALNEALAKIPSSHKQLKDEIATLVAEYTGAASYTHWGS